MAIYHLHVDTIDRKKGGKAAVRCTYIARKGKLDLRCSGQGGIPQEDWCTKNGKADAWRFFHNLDLFETVNAKPQTQSEVIARSIEFALPVELSETQQFDAVQSFLDRIMTDESGHTMAHKWAIHNGKNGQNPHAHIIFSPRQMDEHPRPSPALFFSRAKPKRKAEGGATKRREVGSWAWLQQVRKDWEDCANAALAAAGLDIRISAARVYDKKDPNRPRHKGGWSNRVDEEIKAAAADVEHFQNELEQEFREIQQIQEEIREMQKMQEKEDDIFDFNKPLPKPELRQKKILSEEELESYIQKLKPNPKPTPQ